MNTISLNLEIYGLANYDHIALVGKDVKKMILFIKELIKMLKENLENVEQKIQAMVQEAYDLGIRLFGENKVQEIMDKWKYFLLIFTGI